MGTTPRWIVQLESFNDLHIPLWRIVREDGKPMDGDTLCAALLEEGRARTAEEEVRVADQLIAERNRVLDALPCPVHGQCVPHALNAIASLQAALAAVQKAAQALEARLDDIEPHINNVCAISSNHGIPYAGPTWAQPREVLKKALAVAAALLPTEAP